jgi:hypothetical protein
MLVRDGCPCSQRNPPATQVADCHRVLGATARNRAEHSTVLVGDPPTHTKGSCSAPDRNLWYLPF